MDIARRIGGCLLTVLLTAAVFAGFLGVNLATETFRPDDPSLARAAANKLVLLDLDSAEETAEGARYTLLLPEAEGLYLFQPKANGTRLTVNGVEAESFGLQEQNLFSLASLPEADGLYTLELAFRGGRTPNNTAVCLGTLSEIVSCQSVMFLNRYIALGVNVLVAVLSLTLYLKKRSERYLLLLSLFASLRLFSSVYFTIGHLLGRLSPRLSALYVTVFDLSAGQWFSAVFYALLQFLVLVSFMSIREKKWRLFLPIALSSLPMLFFSTESAAFQNARLLFSVVTAGCYLLCLFELRDSNRFCRAVLSAALALSTGMLLFVQYSQTHFAAYGRLNLYTHLSILQTCVYPVAYLLIACDRFAEKFREADTLNLALEERIRENTRQHTLFIRSMLHNLKTPLFSLSGYSDMAAATVRSNPERSEAYLAKVKENSVYVGHLLDQLFLLTQMDAGQVEFQRINVNLNDLLSSVCDTTLIAAQKKNVRIEADVQEGLFTYGDALYLRQAIQNIADNAVIHTPEGGLITLTAGRVEGGCRLVISDTGCGISAEELPRIFDRYYSNRHGARSSSGLGLTISKMLIEENGGTITAASREGDGACFTITLPDPQAE